jgi:hypothetical protein
LPPRSASASRFASCPRHGGAGRRNVFPANPNASELSTQPLIDAGSHAPKGQSFISPGQRPGNRVAKKTQALKGRNSRRRTMSLAPSGLPNIASHFPGRCPGLSNRCPFGAQDLNSLALRLIPSAAGGGVALAQPGRISYF